MSERPVILHFQLQALVLILSVSVIYLHALLQEQEVAKQELLVQLINQAYNVNSIQVVEDVSGIQPT